MSLLRHSVFQEALFASSLQTEEDDSQDFSLRRWIRHEVSPTADLRKLPIVVFDTETTGLDTQLDRIIEFGAMKFLNGEQVGEFWSFVKTDIELTSNIQSLTGITQDMIQDAPKIDVVLPKFLEFIRGAVLVAHNAEFDMGLLHAACNRLGYELDWPCFCTVKLSRRILPGLANYKLDTIAEHFKLSFESRHRAVGDVKVLASVLSAYLDDDEYGLEKWSDLGDAIIVS